MPGDCGTIDIGCQVGSAVTSGFQHLADQAGKWAGEMTVNAMTWWVRTGSADPNTHAVHEAQGWMKMLVPAVLVGSILWQCIRMALSRNGEPVANIVLGLVRYAAISAVSLVVLAGAVQAGDAFSTVLTEGSAEDFGHRMQSVMTANVITNPIGLFTMGLIMALISACLWFLGFLRQGGILILATMIPLVAAGSINPTTRAWFSKWASMVLALVAFKPMAAIIYVVGFSFLGNGQSFNTVMVGFAILVLSLVALPALTRFFSWTGAGGGGGSAGGGLLAAGGGLAAMAGGRAGGGGGGAMSMSSSGPGSQGGAAATGFGMANPGAAGPGGAPSSGGRGPGASPAPGGDAGASPTAGSAPGGGESGGELSGGAAATSGPSSAAGGGSGAAAGGAAAGGAAAAGGPAGAAGSVANAGYQGAQSAAQNMTGERDD